MTSYGGIFEKGSKEYTLDDFHSLQLDKLDKFVCLKESMVSIPDGEEESSSDEDDDDEEGEDSDDDDEAEVEGSEVETECEEDVDDPPKAKKSKQKTKEKEVLPEVIPAQKLEKEEEVETEDPVCCSTFILYLLNDPRQNSLRSQANAFMGVSKDTARSPEDVLSTPLPGETLAMFYARSRVFAISLHFPG